MFLSHFLYFYKPANILEERMIAQQRLSNHFALKKSSCFTVFIVILTQIYIYNVRLRVFVYFP